MPPVNMDAPLMTANHNGLPPPGPCTTMATSPPMTPTQLKAMNIRLTGWCRGPKYARSVPTTPTMNRSSSMMKKP